MKQTPEEIVSTFRYVRQHHMHELPPELRSFLHWFETEGVDIAREAVKGFMVSMREAEKATEAFAASIRRGMS